MTREEALHHLDTAIRQDRERYYRIADGLHFQPKYADKMAELDALTQQWRDITKLPGYPNIDFPPTLPEWFPAWQFMVLVQDETLGGIMGSGEGYGLEEDGSEWYKEGVNVPATTPL